MIPRAGSRTGAVSGSAGTSPDNAVLDDVTLVVRARDGDVLAYEQLVRRYQGPLFRLAVRMLASRGDAEDAVQEVFLTAWRRLADLRTDAAFVGWLYRMATNRCLNLIRARQATVDVDLAQRAHPRRRGHRARTGSRAVTAGVEIDADRIAVAVQAGRLIVGLDSGRYGEIATYLPGRRVNGVRIRAESVTIGVVGRYPATATDIDACVRASVGPLDRPLHVHINDLHLGAAHQEPAVVAAWGRPHREP
jgi:RNA polymerase sigma-70 factor (ECF subfamily)